MITVAPFPSTERYDPKYDLDAAEGIFPMLRSVATVLLSQSRFLGESLSVLTSGTSFSRFVIAPSDPQEKSKDALQCASLGAFGGFMERSFRAHDFLLGRHNCQKFLQSHFLLPFDNPVIAAGLVQAGAAADKIKTKFKSAPPNEKTSPSGAVWMQVIPLVGSALNPTSHPERGHITTDRIKKIADQILSRLDAIKGPLLADAPLGGLLKLLLGVACTWPFRSATRARIVQKLSEALNGDVKG